MKKSLFLSIITAIAFCQAGAQVTLDSCVTMARENYPLIRRYALLDKISEINISDIGKSWLPQIGVYGQGTLQNAVPTFPSALSGVLQQLGQNINGLEKFQYKAGAELSQNLWDGGEAKSRREVERADLAMKKSELDVQLYAVDERVQNLYFAILLADRQYAQLQSTLKLLEADTDRLRSMFRNGTAMQSDVDMLEAECLTIRQQAASLTASRQAYAVSLSLLTGADITAEPLVCPQAEIPAHLTTASPVLEMYNRRENLLQAQRNGIDVSLMPRIGLFAQAYYGYPGYDYFRSMRSREASFNVMAGVKVSWNIGGLYNRKNRIRKLALQALDVENMRETFLFDNRMEVDRRLAEINGIREVIADDARIVQLRGNVRRAAESRLENGIVDTTALLGKINDENQARLSASIHEIQLLQTIFQLKHTLNR